MWKKNFNSQDSNFSEDLILGTTTVCVTSQVSHLIIPTALKPHMLSSKDSRTCLAWQLTAQPAGPTCMNDTPTSREIVLI